MRRSRLVCAVVLGAISVTYATWTVDAHFDGQWILTRLDGLALAMLSLGAVFVAAPWLWRERRRPSIGAARLPHARAAEPAWSYPPPTALVETTLLIPGVVKRAMWDEALAARAAAETPPAPVAVLSDRSTGPLDEPDEGPMGALELDSYLRDERQRWEREGDEGQP